MFEDDAELARAIARGTERLGQTLPDEAVERLVVLLRELLRWNRRINLTAVRDVDAMVSAHVLDSLSVRPWLSGESAVDVGTGAGFPGLPLAIAETGTTFTLIDSNARKVAFVRHAISRLGLGNATGVASRVEDYAPGRRFDTVLARAVAPLAGVARLGEHLLAPGGVILALKGRHPTAELDDLSNDWTCSVTKLVVPGLDDHARHLVRLTRGADR